MKRSAKLLAASAVAVVCLQVPAMADEPWDSAGYEPAQANQAASFAGVNIRSDEDDEFPGYKDSDYRWNAIIWNWR